MNFPAMYTNEIMMHSEIQKEIWILSRRTSRNSPSINSTAQATISNEKYHASPGTKWSVNYPMTMAIGRRKELLRGTDFFNLVIKGSPPNNIDIYHHRWWNLNEKEVPFIYLNDLLAGGTYYPETGFSLPGASAAVCTDWASNIDRILEVSEVRI